MTDPILWTPTFWTVAPAILVLLGMFFVLAGLRQVIRARPFAGTMTLLGGAALGASGLALAAIGATLLSYTRLTAERPVAEVEVRSLNAIEKRYTVTVRPPGGGSTTCVLQGDEWILGAKVQTWKPWATVLGFDATYALDQLANKYADTGEANGKPITACAIGGPRPALGRYVPGRFTALATALLQIENRRFGSASYMPLADGALYPVIITQNGLAVEPVNDAARAAPP